LRSSLCLPCKDFAISPGIMAGSQKLYPRATIKKIVKAHSKKNVSRNVDVLVS
jgi:hypothetical protein